VGCFNIFFVKNKFWMNGNFFFDVWPLLMRENGIYIETKTRIAPANQRRRT